MEWLKKWKQDVKVMEQQVRDVKKSLRSPWTPEYVQVAYKDQWELKKLKEDLTSMYQYRAASRGKVHTQKEVKPPKVEYKPTPQVVEEDEGSCLAGGYKDALRRQQAKENLKRVMAGPTLLQRFVSLFR